jgi:hypothetical protein
MIAFARERGRMGELINLNDTGMRSSKTLTGLQAKDTGLYDLPSTPLFEDFCLDLADKLPHTFVRAKAARVYDASENDGTDKSNADPSLFGVELVRTCSSDGSSSRIGSVVARHIVLAMGLPGRQNIPLVFKPFSKSIWQAEQQQRQTQQQLPLISHAHDSRKLSATFKGIEFRSAQSSKPAAVVLVVGGGLSAIQAAIAAAKRGADVLLLSRRALTWRHLDLPVGASLILA